jgi:hypothetical protein
LTLCGFRQSHDRLVLEQLLRERVRVAPERLNEYVGCYVTQEWPTVPITIERHGDSLISKARDMRDLLLASSDSEFFTRHHYGQGRFERDQTGRVARLVYREGADEFVAVPPPSPSSRRRQEPVHRRPGRRQRGRGTRRFLAKLTHRKT